MNKSELVAIMAEKASLSKKDAEGALNAFVDAVKDAVKKNDKVQLVGFGTFESRKREAREGKNPQTGEKIKINMLKIDKMEKLLNFLGIEFTESTVEN